MKIESLAKQVGVFVREISVSEEDGTLALPRAQRRTASFKKAVFVGGELVYKGPYEADDTRLRNNLLHTALVLLFERWLDVPSTVREFRELAKNRAGQFYLVSTNLGDPSPQEYEVVTTKIEENVKVLRRGSFLSRLSELEGVSTLPDSIWVSCLQHLYVLYLLGIGDHGSHNVLLGKDQQIVGIDLEEMRKEKTPETRLDSLFKKVSAKQREIYSRYIEEITIFMHPLSAEQEATLSSYELSATQIKSIQSKLEHFLQIS